MRAYLRRIQLFSHILHENFIWFLIGSYVVAACFPWLGLQMRDVTLGHLTLHDEVTTITLPMLMLSLLLFNAGLGVPLAQLRHLVRQPFPFLAGFLANLLVPIAFIFGVSLVMRGWHDPNQVQDILVGLALVASMPIAGSSAAWSQNADGNLALSLGLVLVSTLLSPLTTPVALHSVGWMATGDYSAALHELASNGTGAFLSICVLLPSVLGVLCRHLLGEARSTRLRPALKLIGAIDLLALSYSNAAVSLPHALAAPDARFLGVLLALVVLLCTLAFGAGWGISRAFRLDRSRQVSLMFGLGMNNNGTGLVLASMALSDRPAVMLPIIFYNLVQHLVAGAVDFSLGRRDSE